MNLGKDLKKNVSLLKLEDKYTEEGKFLSEQ